MFQWWPVTSRGSLTKYLSLRFDLSIEDGCTAYLGRLLIPHKLGVVIDILHQGHLERSSDNYLMTIQDEWYQIVCSQNLNLPY